MDCSASFYNKLAIFHKMSYWTQDRKHQKFIEICKARQFIDLDLDESNFEYRIFVVVFSSGGRSGRKSKQRFKIRHVQIDELPKTQCSTRTEFTLFPLPKIASSQSRYLSKKVFIFDSDPYFSELEPERPRGGILGTKLLRSPLWWWWLLIRKRLASLLAIRWWWTPKPAIETPQI